MEIIILSAFAGAGISTLIFRLLKKKQPQNLNDYAAQMIRDELSNEREKNNILERYIAQHVREIADLKQKLKEVEIYNQILKSIPAAWPFPVWMVNMRHEYDYISPLYEEIFLKPRGKTAEECLGKNLYDVWEKELADAFISHNKKVMESGNIYNGIETVTDRSGSQKQWQVLKWKREIPFGLIGAAIPKNGYFDELLNKKNK
jgi:PAS domain-containing protein